MRKPVKMIKILKMLRSHSDDTIFLCLHHPFDHAAFVASLGGVMFDILVFFGYTFGLFFAGIFFAETMRNKK